MPAPVDRRTRTGKMVGSLARPLLFLGMGAGAYLVLQQVLDQETFLKVGAYGSVVFMAIMVLRMLAKFDRERPFTKVAQGIAMITPLATLGVYLFLYTPPSDTYRYLMAGAGVVGLFFGSAWSQSTKLYLKGERVVGKNTGWWLIFWAISFMATKVLSRMARAEGVNISLIVMAFASGCAVGTTSNFIRQIDALIRQFISGRPGPVPAPATAGAAPAAAFCEECGAGLEAGSRFCEACGASQAG